MADALVKHAFVSAVPEGTDPTKIRTSNWNAPLLFTGGSAGQFLVRDTGSATGAAWSALTTSSVGAADVVQLAVKAHSTQTANIQEWQNNAGTLLAAIRNSSTLFFVAGGHESGRGSLQLRDTVSTRSLELGFYQYGCSIVTSTPSEATAPLELMIYSGILSIRNNNATTPASHRIEVRQPDDAPGINLESGYKKANTGNIFGAYLYDDYTTPRSFFIQTADGSGLYLDAGGMVTIGGKILPAATRQLTRFLGADAASASEIAFGWRDVPGSFDSVTWRLRMVAGGRKIGLVYDTSGSNEVIVNGLYWTDDPRLGYGTNAPTARIDVRGSGASGEGTVPLLALRPASGHTANLIEWRNSSGTPLTAIGVTGYLEGTEQTAPAAPAADKGRLFFQDNGAGKTQLMVIFNTGAAQQIAIQP